MPLSLKFILVSAFAFVLGLLTHWLSSKRDRTSRTEMATATSEEEQIPPPTAGKEKKTVKERLLDFAINSLPALVISTVVSVIGLMFAQGYLSPHENHDVVARTLKVNFEPGPFASQGTNGELYADIAVINRGNQTEIIRDVFFCGSDQAQFSDSYKEYTPGGINFQLKPGDKHVFHLSAFGRNSSLYGKKFQLGLGVMAIAPDANDIVCTWKVSEITLAANGQGGGMSGNPSEWPIIQIISNKRLPHQKDATFWP
jgi:hypothetical protein